MIPAKIEDLYIQIQTDFTGTILEIESGTFGIDYFTVEDSIYNFCPFLEETLESLPLEELYELNTMLVVFNSEEFNVDLQIVKLTDSISILIHNKTSTYKYVSQLNQNRNDLFFVKRELAQQNIELERLRKMADRANEEKSRFLAVMSHEIRNPLNIILGYSEMISSETKDSKILRFSKFLLGAGKNLRVIIDDLLDVSRIEAGKLELMKEPISLKDVVGNCVNDFMFQLKESELGLVYLESENLPKFVLGDAVRITQILSNLINNAIKFTKKGTITVGVEVLSDDGMTSTIRFFVSDTGRGMTSDQVKNIFQEYEQTQVQDQLNNRGAGLGLSIVKRLTEVMKGVVLVESEINIGTKFSVEIPFTLEKSNKDL